MGAEKNRGKGHKKNTLFMKSSVGFLPSVSSECSNQGLGTL
jgi:hypothetical protein